MESDRGPEESPALALLDEDRCELLLDEEGARALFGLAGGLDAATVSACPACRSRTLAVVALVDLLDASPPHPRGPEILELADDAPTLHLYVVDRSGGCTHKRWLDPGFEEWSDVVDEDVGRARH